MSRLDADWLTSDATRAVFRLLGDAGYQVFAVGGCVRNTLLGAPVKDIDLSTDARPDRVIGLAKSAGLEAIPTGIDHGTVTVLSEGVPFEITTFRRDVATDGRRAVVAFSDNIEDDARRRDFTMNALYADADGVVHDPLGGLPDLKARRVRFIDDAAERIREDYLRSLRYFRFHAWYGDAEDGFDPDDLDAIARNVDGLGNLSKERIGHEVKRLLEAPDPVLAVAGMRETGVLSAILPGSNPCVLGALVHMEEFIDEAPDAIRRLAALGGDDVANALRLSKKEASRLAAIRDGVAMTGKEAGYRLGPETGRDAMLLTAASTFSMIDRAVLDDVACGAAKTFPIRAADLPGELSGPSIGQALKRLEADWIATGFSMGKDELLQKL